MPTFPVTAENVNAILGKPGVIVIKFWGPKCSHCKTFRPIYENVAKSPELSKATFTSIDTSQEFDLSGDFQVQSLPTIMILKDGKLVFNNPGTMTQNQLKSAVLSFL